MDLVSSASRDVLGDCRLSVARSCFHTMCFYTSLCPTQQWICGLESLPALCQLWRDTQYLNLHAMRGLIWHKNSATTMPTCHTVLQENLCCQCKLLRDQYLPSHVCKLCFTTGSLKVIYRLIKPQSWELQKLLSELNSFIYQSSSGRFQGNCILPRTFTCTSQLCLQSSFNITLTMSPLSHVVTLCVLTQMKSMLFGGLFTPHRCKSLLFA